MNDTSYQEDIKKLLEEILWALNSIKSEMSGGFNSIKGQMRFYREENFKETKEQQKQTESK